MRFSAYWWGIKICRYFPDFHREICLQRATYCWPRYSSYMAIETTGMILQQRSKILRAAVSLTLLNKNSEVSLSILTLHIKANSMQGNHEINQGNHEINQCYDFLVRNSLWRYVTRRGGCSGYTGYFFSMSMFAWMSVMCFDLCWTFLRAKVQTTHQRISRDHREKV
jgi:hypothetical protein